MSFSNLLEFFFSMLCAEIHLRYTLELEGFIPEESMFSNEAKSKLLPKKTYFFLNLMC